MAPTIASSIPDDDGGHRARALSPLMIVGEEWKNNIDSALDDSAAPDFCKGLNDCAGPDGCALANDRCAERYASMDNSVVLKFVQQCGVGQVHASECLQRCALARRTT